MIMHRFMSSLNLGRSNPLVPKPAFPHTCETTSLCAATSIVPLYEDVASSSIPAPHLLAPEQLHYLCANASLCTAPAQITSH